MRFAFYGRVSTEDAQDREASRSWQKRRAVDLIAPHGGAIVTDYFDIGQSRSLPWKRRPEASRLLADVTTRDRGFDAVVIGEPARAFYGPQFALTFPVLTHYGVGLWVPAVGGAVAPGSEAHDLVMTLFGGMSKGERARIQMRVRTAMSALAQDTSRYLGGRPPYGYRLVDASPHPNPAKANLGQRLHRLERDPVTAPIVERIYRMYADGAGLRYIAQQLTDDGVPSPSQYDPARNSHRDPRGWSHSAIRAILDNPAYRVSAYGASRRNTRCWSTPMTSPLGMPRECDGGTMGTGSPPTGGRTRPWFPMNWQKLFVFGYRAGGVQVLYAAENRPCRTRCVGCSTAPRAAGVCRAQRVQESKQRAFSIAASLVSRVRYLSI
ncbi:recombinase family protein [Mycolicibacterium aubagnense]|jgi:DNA invertase Pin-like site-specific DNA recombinase|nr:recombinase family protein [Mycolicibacterium aubagnense]